MARALALTLAAALVLAASLTAQEGGGKKLVGTWTREADGGVKVVFEIKAKTLTCTLVDGTKKLVAQADYGISSDGFVFGRVSKVEKEGVEEGPTEGTLFSFRVAVKGDTLTISDLRAPGGAEAQAILEGEYKGGKK